MATIRKSITFTEQQDRWIKNQIEKGLYTNDSEYIRDLIRKDQIKVREAPEPVSVVDQGLNSGMSTKSLFDIWTEAEHNFKNPDASL